MASQEMEEDAIFWVDQSPLTYDLPEGYTVTSMKETYDLYQYARVLWRGFGHDDDPNQAFDFSHEDQVKVEAAMIRDYVDLDLKIAVVDPQGNFVSYCGMWYDAHAGFAVIEPLATDPDFRRMGLAKAAVLEGISRVAAMGAKKVLVGSSQQFYYSIGLRPYKTSRKWMEI